MADPDQDNDVETGESEPEVKPGTVRSASTSETIKRKALDLGENSDAIMSALTSTREELSKEQQEYTKGATDIRAISESISSAITDAAAVAGKLVEGSTAYKIAQEARNKRIAGSFGVDVDASNEVLSSLASTMQQEGSAYKESLGKYNSLNEVSFFDNPLKWLSAQLNVPQAGAEVNTHARNFNAAESTFHTLTSASTEAIQNNNLASATTDENQAKLLAKAKMLEAVEAAKKVGLLSTKEALEFVGKASAAKVTDLQVLLGVERLTIEEATKRYTNSLRGLQNDAKEEERQQLQNTLDRASIVLGTEVNRGTLNKLNVAEKNAVLKVGVTGRLGENILDSISNKEYLAPTPENVGADKILKKAAGLITPARASVPPQITKPQEINQYVAQGINAKFAEWNFDAGAGGVDNPYIGPSPAAIVKNNVALQQKLPVLMKIFDPLMSNNQPIAPQLLVDTIVKSLIPTDERGRFKLPDAAAIMEVSKELNTYYGEVVKNNNQTYKYATLALPPQETYNARIKGVKGSIPGGGVNMNDMIETSNMLYGSIVQYVKTHPGFESQASEQVRAQAKKQIVKQPSL